MNFCGHVDLGGSGGGVNGSGLNSYCFSAGGGGAACLQIGGDGGSRGALCLWWLMDEDG